MRGIGNGHDSLVATIIPKCCQQVRHSKIRCKIQLHEENCAPERFREQNAQGGSPDDWNECRLEQYGRKWLELIELLRKTE
jgi:hypothetical protein